MKMGMLGSVLFLLFPCLLFSQSLEDIQLRQKEGEPPMIDLGFLGTFEGAMGLNADRPEYYTLVYAAPQLKLGRFVRVQLNMTMNRAILDRQENAFFPGHQRISPSKLRI